MKRISRTWVTLWAALLATTVAGGAAAQITGELVNPNVMLLIDSSGSMDWLEDPSAATPWQDAEAACRAQDSNRQTSWQKLVDVMLGGIPAADYRCMVEDQRIRPAIQADTIAADPVEHVAEYREAFYPHFRSVPCASEDWNEDYQQCIGASLDPTEGAPHGEIWCRDADWDVTHNICYDLHPLSPARRTNGILERYSSLVRFGLMTYDNMPAPAAPGLTQLPEPHDGLWDFSHSRKWRCKEWYYDTLPSIEDYPACTWNMGARDNHSNAVGRLVPISSDMVATNQSVRHVLETTEPLNCSPMGSILDDIGHYFHSHPDVRPADNGGNDRYFWCRPKIAIYISDGQPTPAFEFPQDYCDLDSAAPPAPEDQATAAPDEVYRCP